MDKKDFDLKKLGKWIAGGFGWALMGPIGGISMFALGSLYWGF